MNKTITLGTLGLGTVMVLAAACGNDDVTEGMVVDSWHVAGTPTTTAYCAVSASAPGPSGGGSRSSGSSSSRSTGGKNSSGGLFGKSSGGSKIKTTTGPKGVQIRKDKKGRLVGKNGKPCPRVDYLYTVEGEGWRLLLRQYTDGKTREGWVNVSPGDYAECSFTDAYPACKDD